MSKRVVLPHLRWSAERLWQFKPLTLLVLLASLALIGLAEALLIRAQLGVVPWTVLAQGVSKTLMLPIGWANILISLFILIFWILLKLRIGLGTIMNVLTIPLFIEIGLRFIPKFNHFGSALLAVLLALILFALASAFYLSCLQGGGPRDGLMVGICQYFNWRIPPVRFSIEASVCFLGWLLGGKVGIATFLFALSIGYLLQLVLNGLIILFKK